MSDTILVAYATRQGSTQEVAEAIAETLREHWLEVDIQPVRNVRSLGGYRAVVLGAPFYMYHWHKDARHFLARNRVALTERPIAIFALGPLHNDEKEFQTVREQLDKELTKYPWLTIAACAIFGGKIDPAKLHFPFNRMPEGDIRDWTIIRAWASELAAKFQPAPA
jgi:menaquinone-dependent protoporphyrinogen oxidase